LTNFITSKKNNIATFDELIYLIEQYFGMPLAIATEVLSELQMIRDAWD
jgi:hypothetical protein